MKLVLFIVALTIVAAAAIEVRPGSVSEFQQWASKHSKTYGSTAEFWKRFNIFQQAKQRMAQLQKSNPEAVFAPNQFSDLTREEFKRLYLTAKPPKDLPRVDVASISQDVQALPASFDWRTHNAVTPVKDQGQCGSCWAFSATENIESMWILGGYKMAVLAPQQIVDCDTTDSGCDGGWPMSAMDYIVSAPGQDTEASYPYTSGDSGQAGNCQYASNNVAANITGYKYALPPCQDSCTSQNETLLMQQLVNVGPLSICVDAEPWQDYSGGILSDCPSDYDDLDHCVQLVGYDTKGGYYIVRNSWGTSWGESGYIRLKLNQNTCGLADCATYATVKKKA